MSGDLSQVMADITPEAMAKLMQLGNSVQAGAPTPGSMPSIQSYSLEPVEEGDEHATFRVTFVSATGKATLEAQWQQLMGQWKVTDIGLISAEVTMGEAPN